MGLFGRTAMSYAAMNPGAGVPAEGLTPFQRIAQMFREAPIQGPELPGHLYGPRQDPAPYAGEPSLAAPMPAMAAAAATLPPSPRAVAANPAVTEAPRRPVAIDPPERASAGVGMTPEQLNRGIGAYSAGPADPMLARPGNAPGGGGGLVGYLSRTFGGEGIAPADRRRTAIRGLAAMGAAIGRGETLAGGLMAAMNEAETVPGRRGRMAAEYDLVNQMGNAATAEDRLRIGAMARRGPYYGAGGASDFNEKIHMAVLESELAKDRERVKAGLKGPNLNAARAARVDELRAQGRDREADALMFSASNPWGVLGIMGGLEGMGNFGEP